MVLDENRSGVLGVVEHEMKAKANRKYKFLLLLVI